MTDRNEIADIVESYTDILSPETARKVAGRIRGITAACDRNAIKVEAFEEAAKRCETEAAEQNGKNGDRYWQSMRLAGFVRALKQEGASEALPERSEPSSSSSPQVERMREALIIEVIRLMDKIGCDWRDAGEMRKFYATNYLVEAIHSALSPKEGAEPSEKDALGKAAAYYSGPYQTRERKPTS